MSQHLIFWPMIVQVALTYCVYSLLLKRRIAAVKGGEAKAGDFRGRESAEPQTSRTVFNNLGNQFELPVLFYAVCGALFITGGVTMLTLGLAWVFALSRIAHAVVHLGANRLSRRQPIFMIGFFATALLWLVFALQLAAR